MPHCKHYAPKNFQAVCDESVSPSQLHYTSPTHSKYSLLPSAISTLIISGVS
jgi:hypothetical protein